MKKSLLALIALLTVTLGQAQNLTTHKDSVSYALGVSMAEALKKSGITDYDLKSFTNAIEAHLKDQSVMDSKTADMIYRAESKKVAEEKNKQIKAEGEKFLAENKTKPGVQVTASGLQYKHDVVGTGASPTAADRVTVNYTGTFIDGKVFDSSVKQGKPITFGLTQVIAGWTEGLQLMREGGKTTFYIPQNLAYGPAGKGSIPPYSMLIFEIELVAIEKAAAAPNTQPQGGTKPTTTPPTPAPQPGVTNGKAAPAPTTQPAKGEKKK